ncbi:MAG: NAD-dependent epimerase/dehydratase family protein [Bacteroidetes bacterium]|nr:NAD-dependent epimerase/dehydratase family protein [Bacteroidota bacterium]
MSLAASDSKKIKVALAGAGGYIGRWFISRFKEKYHLIGLSRGKVASNPYPEVEWRQVELYSISSTADALKDVDVAIYLVHSMSASARLNQVSFEDTDLILADNFSRAAEINGIKQLIYLGGLIPNEPEEFLSRHLKSRLEVEQTLGSRTAKLTAIRASIIVGPGGSSFDMIKNLVQKLPVLMCPKWTESLTQPISLDDTLSIMDACIGNPNAFGKTYEIGSPEVLSYKNMLARTAQVMGKRRFIFSVPVFSLGFSKFWVGFFGKSPPQLVSPLVESLKHTLVVDPNRAFDVIPIDYIPYEKAVSLALNPIENPQLPKFIYQKEQKNTVRSIQRMSNIGRNSALWVADRYAIWLPSFFRFVINGKVNEQGALGFYLLWGKKPMLELTHIPDRSDSQRQLFYITGGWLVKRFDYGWLEFREVLDSRYILSAIHEFVPRLPWFLYITTQARLHLWVMNRFKKYLETKIDE